MLQERPRSGSQSQLKPIWGRATGDIALRAEPHSNTHSLLPGSRQNCSSEIDFNASQIVRRIVGLIAE
jgi:hypothetical protein